MKCPRCSGGMLEERTRESIEIDVCGGCRGVWLDRGELEQFIDRAERSADFEEMGRRLRDEDEGRYQGRRKGWIREFFQ